LSIIETLLVFVGIPALVVIIVFGLVYSGGAKRARRYRPGRPFDFAPVWFLAAPEQVTGDRQPTGNDRRAVGDAARPALTRGDASAGAPAGTAVEPVPRGEAGRGGVIADVTTQDATGGASDRW
jgi:hypothetical protein